MDHISQRHIPNFSSGSYDNGTNHHPPWALPHSHPQAPHGCHVAAIDHYAAVAGQGVTSHFHARLPRAQAVLVHHTPLGTSEHVGTCWAIFMEGEAREVTWKRTWGNKCWVTITIKNMDGGCTSCYIVTWAVLLDDGLQVEMVGWLQLNSPSAREWTRQNGQGLYCCNFAIFAGIACIVLQTFHAYPLWEPKWNSRN